MTDARAFVLEAGALAPTPDPVVRVALRIPQDLIPDAEHLFGEMKRRGYREVVTLSRNTVSDNGWVYLVVPKEH